VSRCSSFPVLMAIPANRFRLAFLHLPNTYQVRKRLPMPWMRAASARADVSSGL
jgi:hypothetical protein